MNSTAKVRYNRARRLYEQGLNAEALRVLEDAAPEQANCCLFELRGVIHHAAKQYQAGLDALQVAENLGGVMCPQLALVLADCYFFTGQKDLARDRYCKLAFRTQTTSGFLSTLALGLGRVGEYAQALNVCQQAAMQFPECHHARYAVAYYMSKCKYPPEFIWPVIQGAIELGPEVFSYRVTAATVLTRMKKIDRAYLTVADATNAELESVRCRCCLTLLTMLYQSGGDERRAAICRDEASRAGKHC